MIRLAAFLAVVVTVGAIVCTPDMCDGVEKTPLTCPGSVIKGGGFCGCTDICAKVEGDLCEKAPLLIGPQLHGQCDTGLVCNSVGGGSLLDLFGKGKCVKNSQSKRLLLDGLSACQKMKIIKASQPTYSDKWTPKCDDKGAFEPMQCDLAGLCFCVNSEGQVQGSRVQGKVTCPSA